MLEQSGRCVHCQKLWCCPMLSERGALVAFIIACSFRSSSELKCPRSCHTHLHIVGCGAHLAPSINSFIYAFRHCISAQVWYIAFRQCISAQAVHSIQAQACLTCTRQDGMSIPYCHMLFCEGAEKEKKAGNNHLILPIPCGMRLFTPFPVDAFILSYESSFNERSFHTCTASSRVLSELGQLGLV